MPSAIPAIQRVQTHTLERMTTEILLFYHCRESNVAVTKIIYSDSRIVSKVPNLNFTKQLDRYCHFIKYQPNFIIGVS
jgi:hypothetical protein